MAASSASVAHLRNRPALRIKSDRQRVPLFDRVRRAGCPDRLLAPQEFAAAAAFRMHGDDEIVGLAEPIGHGGGQSCLHLDADVRIAGDKTRQQRRHDQGAVVVHHAQTHASLDLAFEEPADRIVVQRQHAARVAEKPFARRSQGDVRLRAMKELDAQPHLEALDLHTDRRLRAVEHGGGAGEGAMVRHRDERFEQIEIEERQCHNGSLFSA